MYKENYELLADAIVIQAANDYRRAKSPQARSEVKRFFLSDWFMDLTEMRGQKIIKTLEQERIAKIEGRRQNNVSIQN